MQIAQLHANVKTNNFVLFNLNYICVILKCVSMDMGIYTTIQKFGIGKVFLFFYDFERRLLCSLRSHLFNKKNPANIQNCFLFLLVFSND